jgi:hypothetical protein
MFIPSLYSTSFCHAVGSLCTIIRPKSTIIAELFSLSKLSGMTIVGAYQKEYPTRQYPLLFAVIWTLFIHFQNESDDDFDDVLANPNRVEQSFYALKHILIVPVLFL